MPSIINALTASGGGVAITGDATGNLALQTAGNTAVTVTTSSDVGIGTASPANKLDVNSSDNYVARFQNSTNQSLYVYSSSNLSGLVAESTGQNGILFNSNSDFGYIFTDGAERMRVTSTGQLGLGVTPSGWGGGFKVLQIGRGSYSADGTSNLQISMNAYYNGSDWKYISANKASNMYLDLGGGIYTRTTNTTGTVDGSISWTDGPYVAAGGTSWTSSSDENLKNITGEIDDALNKVTQLRAAKFTWKADTENTPQVGLIAQDLQNVLPECVVVPDEKIDSQGTPKFLGVNYDQVIPLLVAAIKELKAELDETKAEVQALKGVK